MDRRQSLMGFWIGLTSTTVVARTLSLTYPLLALDHSGSPMAVGWASFMLALPGFLFYLPFGAIIDRIDPSQLMRLVEVVRALMLLLVGGLLVYDFLSLPVILAAAFIEGAMWIAYSLAEAALIPMVRSDRLTRFLASSERSTQVGSLIARPLAGFLYGLQHTVPFLVAPLFLLVSALTVPSARVRRTEVRGRREPLWASMGEGLRELARHRFLMVAVILTSTTNLMINALIVVFIAGYASELDAADIGFYLMFGSIGGTVGTFLARTIRPENWVLYVQLAVAAVAMLAIALRPSPASFALGLLLTGWGTATNIAMRSYEGVYVRRRKRARVASVSRLLSHTAVTVAAPLGGALVTVSGVDQAASLLAWGFAFVAGSLLLWRVVSWTITVVSRYAKYGVYGIFDAPRFEAMVGVVGLRMASLAIGHPFGQAVEMCREWWCLRRHRGCGEIGSSCEISGLLLDQSRVKEGGTVFRRGRAYGGDLIPRFVDIPAACQGVRIGGADPWLTYRAESPEVDQSLVGTVKVKKDLGAGAQGGPGVGVVVEHAVERPERVVLMTPVPIGPRELDADALIVRNPLDGGLDVLNGAPRLAERATGPAACGQQTAHTLRTPVDVEEGGGLAVMVDGRGVPAVLEGDVP
ncbi:MFS transporter [Herbidospora galbida]|uniref:MFS transporter n=1 Tax=Herbidospora galbida TaxID=2575442 RepID=A0A4U3MP88_9ACTN|nr:MFS transporter [Herbidospora galbida]